MPFLKIITGTRSAEGHIRHEITSAQVFIGRNPGNDIVVEGIGIAGYHARIIKTEHGYLLIEERAANGIWVEHRQVGNLFLRHGTQFRLGETCFEFELEASEAPTVALPSPVAPAAVAAEPAPPPPAAPPEPAGPAWARTELDLASQLSGPPPRSISAQYSSIGNNCAGCKAPLIGMERYCSLCGSRTKFGGRGRVTFLKVVALLLVLGAGGVGAYMLTDGDLSRKGYARALEKVFAGNPPAWLQL